MSENYLKLSELMAYLKLGRSSIYRRIEDGSLPKPIKLGRLSRFKQSEVLEALSRMETRRDN